MFYQNADDPKTTKHGINQAGRGTYQLGPLSQDTADVGNGARRGCSHAGTVLAQARSDAGVLSMSRCQCICQLRMSSCEKRGLYIWVYTYMIYGIWHSMYLHFLRLTLRAKSKWSRARHEGLGQIWDGKKRDFLPNVR